MTPGNVLDGAVEIFRGVMGLKLRDISWHLESPIEALFAAGVIACDAFDKESINLSSDKVTYGEVEDPEVDGIVCWPQASVGKYRVDFLLRRKFGDSVTWVVVECDGHAFHEKTKAQVAKDKRRDRFFTSIGLPVVHFTGSELNKSAWLCAREAISVLHVVRADV